MNLKNVHCVVSVTLSHYEFHTPLMLFYGLSLIHVGIGCVFNISRWIQSLQFHLFTRVKVVFEKVTGFEIYHIFLIQPHFGIFLYLV